MVAQPYARRLDVDPQPVTEAIVQALLADPAVTADRATNGYAGVGTRIYPDSNTAPDLSGQGQDFPFLVVVCVSSVVLVDNTHARLDALFDITTIDRGHTPNNFVGGTQNVVGVAQAAWARLTQHALTVTGYTEVEVVPVAAPRGTSPIQAGVVYRQRRCSVRVRGNWDP